MAGAAETQEPGAQDSLRRYALHGGLPAKQRLDLIAGVLRPSTLAVLDQVGIRAGDRCLDVGCGGGHVTAELARLTGPDGAVLGIDVDASVLELAAQTAPANVSFQQGDVDTLEGGDYDVVYARFLLTHLADPQGALDRMIACLRPGGVLVVEDIDHSGVACHPPSAAYARYAQLYEELIGRRGGDPDIGLKLPVLLRRTGLDAVEVGIAQPVFLEGAAKHVHVITLDGITRTLTAEGLASEREVAELRAEMVRYGEREDAIVTWPRIVQVRGRRHSFVSR